MSKVIHLEELYTWLPYRDQKQARTFLIAQEKRNKTWYEKYGKGEFKNTRLERQYVEVSDEVYAKLQAAYELLNKLAEEIDEQLNSEPKG
jgi:hypothetical protein